LPGEAKRNIHETERKDSKGKLKENSSKKRGANAFLLMQRKIGAHRRGEKGRVQERGGTKKKWELKVLKEGRNVRVVKWFH